MYINVKSTDLPLGLELDSERFVQREINVKYCFVPRFI